MLINLINFAKFVIACVSGHISLTSYGICLLYLSHFFYVPLSLNIGVVGQLASFSDRESYVGGSFTPGRFNQAELVLGEKPDKYSDTPFAKQEWFQLGVTINLPILQLLSDVRLADESTHGQW